MPSLVSSRLRGLPRAVWVLLAGTLITRAGSFALPFLTIFLHEQRGLSTAAAGLAMTAWGTGGIFASLTGGALADRIGRKPVVVAAPALGGLAVCALAVSQAPATVLVAAFVAGMVSEAGRPAVTALLTDLAPFERRVDTFALFRLVINLGFAVGTGIGGLLITEFGFVRLFVADAATSWIYAVVALVLIPETRPRGGSRHADAPARGFATVVADRTFRRLWIGTLVNALVFVQPMATLGLILSGRGISTSVYGLLMSVNGLIIITTEFWLSGRTRRYSAPRVMALSSLVMGVGFALTGAVGRSIPLLVLTVAIWTTGEMLGAPTSQTYLASIAPADLRGRYAGAYGLSWSVASAVGPVLGGVALLGGGLPLWIGSLVLSTLAAWLFYTLPSIAPVGAPVTDAGPLLQPPNDMPDVAVEVADELAQPDDSAAGRGGRLIARLARPRS